MFSYVKKRRKTSITRQVFSAKHPPKTEGNGSETDLFKKNTTDNSENPRSGKVRHILGSFGAQHPASEAVISPLSKTVKPESH